MATVPTVAMRKSLLGIIAGLLAALSVGCVATESNFLTRQTPPPCTGKACQIVCTWMNSVAMVPDPTKGGKPGPGFVGRVYLFGETIDHPLLAQGKLIVDLIEESGPEARWVERWEIDPDTLQRLVRKDLIGWGYTIFLPSKEYHPEMSKIRFRTGFAAEKAAPIYTENVVTLDMTNGVLREGTSPIRLPGGSPTGPTQAGPGTAPADSGKRTLPPPIPIR